MAPTAPTQLPSGFHLTSISHTTCERCDNAVQAAVSMTRVTGSVGATYTYDDPDAVHSAVVRRDPAPINA